MLSRYANALSWPVKVYVLGLTHLVLSLLDIEVFREVGDFANLNCSSGNCFVSHFYTFGLNPRRHTVFSLSLQIPEGGSVSPGRL